MNISNEKKSKKVVIKNTNKNNEKKEPEEAEEKYTNEEIINAFKFFDPNNEGVISVKELKIILTGFDTKISKEKLEEIIIESNLQNEEKFNYKDFVEYWNAQ